MGINCAKEVADFMTNSHNLQIWIPAAVSIVSLLVNLGFYVFVQPKLTYKVDAKGKLMNTAVEFMNYLTEIVSFDDFNGVPTQIRKYSLQIHLHFKSGTAPKEVADLMETIFQNAKNRKGINTTVEIDSWNADFRDNVRKLRIELAKYCGEI